MNKFQQSIIKKIGRNRILIKWEEEVNRDLLNHILKVQKIIKQSLISNFEYSIKSYNELAIVFKDSIDSSKINIKEINEIALCLDHEEEFITHVIKVNYDRNTSDMDRAIDFTKLDRSTLISIHADPLYDVHFVGFLPGFIYLGGLDKRLIIPRKLTPSLVPKGSIAIGGIQTGIYPQTSPGGWTVLGTTTHSVFDVNSNPPMRIRSGDYLKFEAL